MEWSEPYSCTAVGTTNSIYPEPASQIRRCYRRLKRYREAQPALLPISMDNGSKLRRRDHKPASGVVRMSRRRVAITGLGAICALGADVAEMWTAVCEGRSGVTPIHSVDTSDLRFRN